MTHNIISFQTSHLDEIELRKMDYDLFSIYGKNKDAFKVCEGGSAVTYIRDNEIIGCGGVFPLWKGVGQCWAIGSKDYKKYWLTVGKYMLLVVETAFEQFDLHRIQGTARAEHKEGIKWLKWAGFLEEGLLKNYGSDGKDHIMFARLRNVI